MMNLKSLAQYNVKPDDSCIQGVPCVIVERLSDSEISQWLRVSEISRKVRLEIQQIQYSSPEVIRIDYDKQTSSIGKNDMVRYVSFDERVKMSNTFGQWRSSTGQQRKSLNHDQGRVGEGHRSKLGHTITRECAQFCCIGLTSEFSKLKIPTISINSEMSPYINSNPSPCNPFRLAGSTVKREVCNISTPKPSCSTPKIQDTAPLNELGSKKQNLKRNPEYLSPAVDEFCLNPNQQPALVPTVEDFERTLNLGGSQNFSPNMHSSSPQSHPFSHPYLTDPWSIETPLSIAASATANALEKCPVTNVKSTGRLTSMNITTPDVRKEETYTAESIVEIGDKIMEEDTKLEIKEAGNQSETRLPLKKRKLSVARTKEDEDGEDDVLGPDLVEEIIKRARAERTERDEISYPAIPMISIAEVQAKLAEPHPRVFKTPAERKEMPPAPQPPVPSYAHSGGSPRIITEQYNNHTYNNPTINYHMGNVPYPFFPCGSLQYFPPILLPLNSRTTFDLNLVHSGQTTGQQHQQPNVPEESDCVPRRAKGKRKKTSKN